MPTYLFYLSAVAEKAIEADSEEEAREILSKMSISAHDWHDVDVSDEVEMDE